MKAMLKNEMTLGSLKEGKWYVNDYPEIYCNSVLLKRLNESEVMLAPLWKTSYVDHNGNTVVELEEVPGEHEYWYDMIHEDSLMLTEEYSDCVWLEMTVDLITELWYTLNDLRANEGFPERLQYLVKQTITSDSEDYITKKELEELGFSIGLKNNDLK